MFQRAAFNNIKDAFRGEENGWGTSFECRKEKLSCIRMEPFKPGVREWVGKQAEPWRKTTEMEMAEVGKIICELNYLAKKIC